MKLNILYCCDNNYAPYTGVSMASVMENNRNAEEIVFYVVCDRVSEDNLCRMKKQVKAYGDRGRLVLIDGRDWVERLVDMTMLTYRGGHAANLRLFFTEYIEEDVERVLYLDSDTIVCQSLASLFGVEMGADPVGVVLDSLSAYYKPVVGFADEDHYFNSGMILFDVRNWKERRCKERLLELLRDYPKPHFMNPDQDVLNILLKDQKRVLSPKYNFQTTHQVYSNAAYYANYSRIGYYAEEQINEARRQPVVLHAYRFLGQFPWHRDAIHPWRDLWWAYVAKSEWRDLVPRENKGAGFALERVLYKLLPKRMFLFVFQTWQTRNFNKRLGALSGENRR